MQFKFTTQSHNLQEYAFPDNDRILTIEAVIFQYHNAKR